MALAARFGHTNLIARDWRRLAAFYTGVFGCQAVPPERKLGGEALERGTRVRGARLSGVHLRLPGHGEGGPTLEIYSYEPEEIVPPAPPNRTGFGHIAFTVPDVAGALAAVVAAGGAAHGEIVTTPAGDRRITWVYARDPEGNLIELQSVSVAAAAR